MKHCAAYLGLLVATSDADWVGVARVVGAPRRMCRATAFR